jgi:hypothetical protein
MKRNVYISTLALVVLGGLLSNAHAMTLPPATAVPEPATIVSGALLLVPLGVAMARACRKPRK